MQCYYCSFSVPCYPQNYPQLSSVLLHVTLLVIRVTGSGDFYFHVSVSNSPLTLSLTFICVRIPSKLRIIMQVLLL